MELQWIIDHLQETYNSIDIRIFSFLEADEWHNVFTIIRFRRESPEELEKIHEEIIKKCKGLIRTGKFKVSVYQLSISQWIDLDKNLLDGYLSLPDSFRVNFDNDIVLNQNSTEPYTSDKEYVFKDWPVFQGENETRKIKPSYDEELQDHAIKKKFSNFNDYLAAIFQMNKYFFQQSPKIFTFVPVFFKIDNVIFNHDKIEVTYSAFKQKDLEITINFFNAQFYNKSEFVDKKIEKMELADSSKLIQDTLTLKIDTTSLGNEFEILVIKNEILLIAKHRDRIGSNWKGRSEFTNPLYHVFEKFVDYNKLKKMLFDFESKNFKDPAKAFEQGISWLLSLLGIPNIWLGDYDTIHDNGKTISTDVLGSIAKNELIIVHVTKGLPKPSDFDREKEYRENLTRLLKNPDLKIRSVYFTGAEPTESKTAAETNEVILFGHSQIALVLQHLEKGELLEARKIILVDDNINEL